MFCGHHCGGSEGEVTSAEAISQIVGMLGKVTKTIQLVDLSYNRLSRGDLRVLQELIQSIPPNAPLREVRVDGNAEQNSRVAVYAAVLRRHIRRK